MRCKCCNNPLKTNEIIWYPDRKCHEEFCSKCKGEFLLEYTASGGNIEKIGATDDTPEEE